MAASWNSSALLLASLIAIAAAAQFLEPAVSQSVSPNQRQLGNNATNGNGGGVRTGRAEHCCPSGWMTYLDSCFLFVRERRQFQQAEHFCYQRQSTLFVANTLDEWDSVRLHGSLGAWTWIGLRVVSAIEPIRPTWETANGMDPELLPWLHKQNKHGWREGSDCASYFHPYTGTSDQIYFSACSDQNYFICELNATEIRMASSAKAAPVDPSWWWT